MSQVHISGATHTVTVNHDGSDLTYVIEKAQKLWDETKPADSTPGPAFGFQAEREHRRDTYAWNIGEGGQPAVKP